MKVRWGGARLINGGSFRFAVSRKRLLVPDIDGGGPRDCWRIQLQRLPIDAVPDVTNVQVQILTALHFTCSARDRAARSPPSPIGSRHGGLPGIEEIRSVSKFRAFRVTVVTEESTSIYFAERLFWNAFIKLASRYRRTSGSPSGADFRRVQAEIYRSTTNCARGRGSLHDATSLRTIQVGTSAAAPYGRSGVTEIEQLRWIDEAILPGQGRSG